MNPLVSVLIPTYNRRDFIIRAVESALAQTYKPLEIVIYDDGSKDRTGTLLRDRFGGSERIQYCKDKRNRGVTHARTELLAMAKGEYGCWLDSDDMCNRYRVALLVQAVEKWNAPFARSGFWVLREEELKAWPKPPLPGQPRRHAPATSLFRMELAPEFHEEITYYGEDVIWESELALKHGTGMLVPFGLYYIGRGRHNRLMAALHSKVKKEKAEENERIFVQLKNEIWPQLKAKGINPHCRIERLPPAALELPFPLDRTVEENVKLKPLFINANLSSTARWNGEIVGG